VCKCVCERASVHARLDMWFEGLKFARINGNNYIRGEEFLRSIQMQVASGHEL